MKNNRYSVKGMTCGHCVAGVKRMLESNGGLSNVLVSLEAAECSFDSENEVGISEVRELLNDGGYEVGEV